MHKRKVERKGVYTVLLTSPIVCLHIVFVVSLKMSLVVTRARVTTATKEQTNQKKTKKKTTYKHIA